MATFSSDLANAVKGINEDVKTQTKTLMFELFSTVIISSPVKTGRFRANWGMGYTAESAPNSGTETDASGNSTINKIRTELEAIKQFKSPIFLTNNMPYAVALEDGYSAQAPNGMVANSITVIKAKYGT